MTANATLDIGRKAGHAEAIAMMRAILRESDRLGPDFALPADVLVEVAEHALAEGWHPDALIGTLEELPEGERYVDGQAVSAASKGGLRWRFYADRGAIEHARWVDRINSERARSGATPIRHR